MPAYSSVDSQGITMFDKLTTDEVMEMAHRVGRKVSRDNPAMDAEDIASEALVRLADRAEAIRDAEPGYVYTVMLREAELYATKQRYDYMLSKAAYVYTPREVRALLAEAFFDQAAWDCPSQKDDYLSASISKGTIVVSLIDLKTASELLTASQREVLLRRYAEGDEETPAKPVSRAIAALTRHMNRTVSPTSVERDGPGTRRVMGNVAAQNVTSYESEQRTTHRRDALADLQFVRRGAPSDPPGTHFNW